MFVDTAIIKIKAGNGGDGAVSFHRDKMTAWGGPDGGNGGSGGNVVFVADSNISTLSDFRYKKKHIAEHGQNGMSSNKTGKSGEDLILKVPFGTLIKDEDTGDLIADISTDESKVIAKGGKGGAGNANFATPTRQSPRFSKPGTKGEEFNLKLELKLLADVGLVGFPNVGKSTLISVVSEAKPQIANYHFTTLSPILGVVKYKHQSFVMADIPGLIEGAWKGSGLGHKFLRHIERCRLILHIVDISGSEGRNPIEDFETINEELRKFNLELANRPVIVVGNKSDIATDLQISEFKKYIEDKNLTFLELSAATKFGIEKMLDLVTEKLSKLPMLPIFTPGVREKEEDADTLKIEKKDGVFELKAKWLERLTNSVNFDDYDSMNYFQNFIIKSGVQDALKEKGVKNGDIVRIYGIEFEFFS